MGASQLDRWRLAVLRGQEACHRGCAGDAFPLGAPVHANGRHGAVQRARAPQHELVARDLEDGDRARDRAEDELRGAVAVQVPSRARVRQDLGAQRRRERGRELQLAAVAAVSATDAAAAEGEPIIPAAPCWSRVSRLRCELTGLSWARGSTAQAKPGRCWEVPRRGVLGKARGWRCGSAASGATWTTATRRRTRG